MRNAGQRRYLLDASRLVWRRWSGRYATGIDRVCLAYADRFLGKAAAVLQYRGHHLVLDDRASDALFGLLLGSHPGFRARLLGLLATSGACTAGSLRDRIYLNVGHTGVDSPRLQAWTRRAGLCPVYLVHDLIPLTHPEYCRPGESGRHRRRMRNILASARGVICNSEATLIELSRFARSEGVGMPPGIAAWIAGKSFGEIPGPGPSDRPYFVIAGTIEGRKNHILLLQLWKRLVRELGSDAPDLVIAGQRGWEADHVFAMLGHCPELRHHVRLAEECDDRMLAALVKGARALLMPSFAEGFGLPLIEALALGTPVIASDLPVFGEIGSGIPALLDPLDGPGWHRMIRAFMVDGPERRGQLARLSRFQAPDWPAHFNLVEQWLETLPPSGG